MMNSTTLKKMNRQAFQFLVVFLALCFGSCAHLAHLDHAQDSFSKGATIENQQLFDSKPSSTVPAETYYSLAYGQVNSALKQKGKLANVGVLGSAYTIKALCEWKLKDYEAAKSTAKEAKRNLKTGKSRPELRRDYTVMEAMDGLVGVQMANDSLYVYFGAENLTIQKSKKIYDRLISNANNSAMLQTALTQLSEVGAKTGANNEVKIYLQNSKLAGLKVWSDALHLCKTLMQSKKQYKDANKEWYDEQQEVFLEKKKEYLKSLDKLLELNPNKALREYWDLIL